MDIAVSFQEVTVAHHKSAIKRIRTNELRRLRNQKNRTRLRNVIKDYRQLLADGNIDGAKAALPQVVSSLQHSVTKGIIKKNNASRQASRLSLALNRLSDKS